MPRTLAPWEIDIQTLVKAEEKADPRYGSVPEDRKIDAHLKYGVINLDKPAGPSSHEVAAWTKKLLKVDSVGHGGTLEAQA